jgi:hypothetical protein
LIWQILARHHYRRKEVRENKISSSLPGRNKREFDVRLPQTFSEEEEEKILN